MDDTQVGPRPQLPHATRENREGTVGHCADSPLPEATLTALPELYPSHRTSERHDSVTILLFSVSQRCLVLVKQSRPTVYAGKVGLYYQVSLAAKDQDRSQSCRG